MENISRFSLIILGGILEFGHVIIMNIIISKYFICEKRLHSSPKCFTIRDA